MNSKRKVEENKEYVIGENATTTEQQPKELTFLDRLSIEVQGLLEKRQALAIFLDGEDSKKLDPLALDLLQMQFHAMGTYAKCLNIRINLLKK
jgi:hypothetical protein